MSLPWLTIVTGILGLGVVALAGVSLLLWRRVNALAARVDRATWTEPVSVPVVSPPTPTPPPGSPHPATASAIPAPRVAVVNRPRPVAAPDPRPGEPVGPTLIAVPDLRTAPAADRGSSPLDGRFGEVGALASAGATAAEIADQTGYPVGQVELILGLLRHRAAVVAGAGSDG